MKKLADHEVLLTPGWASKTGVMLVQRERWICARCPECNVTLGWTWVHPGSMGRHRTSNDGFWSCLVQPRGGCGTEYPNRLGPITSSEISTNSSTRSGRGHGTLETWISGWLGIPEDQLTIEVNE